MAFSFGVNLKDGISQTGSTMVASLSKIEAGLGKLGASLAGVENQVGRFRGLWAGLEIGQLAARGFAAAAAAASNLGRAIVGAAAAAEDLGLAARLQLGDGGAGEIARIAKGFANTRFDTAAVQRALLPLANAGIRDERMLDDIATAGADVAARLGTGDQGFAAATAALGKIALRRKAEGEQLAALGLNEREFLAAVGQATGRGIDATRKAIAAGEVAAPTLMRAALSEVARVQGGELGTAALASGRTLGAALARAHAAPLEAFRSAAESPGSASLASALDEFAAVVRGPAGIALISGMSSLAAEMVRFGALAVRWFGDHDQRPGQDGPGGLRRDEGGAIVAAPIDGGLPGDGRTRLSWKARFSRWIGWDRDLFRDGAAAGATVGKGVAAGIGSSVQVVSLAGAAVGDAAIAGVRGPRGLDARSPSRRGLAAGGDLGVGLVQGARSWIQDAAAAGAALGHALVPSMPLPGIAPPWLPSMPLPGIVPPVVMGGAPEATPPTPNVVTLNGGIHVEINAASTDDPAALGRLVAEAARREILRTFDRLAVAW